MKQQKKLKSERLTLRSLEPSDCNQKYLDWLLDPAINQYLETRWSNQTLSSIRDYVETINASCDSFLYGIFLTDTNEHIGNIKLGPCNFYHGFADISYLIGSKQFWGKGIAPEAIQCISHFAFQHLKLELIIAGVYSGNLNSLKVLDKCGFVQSGIIEKKLVGPNGREDHIYFSKRKSNFLK